MATYEYAERNPVEFGKPSGPHPRVTNEPQNRGMYPFSMLILYSKKARLLSIGGRSEG